MEVDSFNLKHCTRRIQVQTEYWKEHLVIVSTLSEFTFIVSGYKFCYSLIPTAFLEELSSKRRNKKSLKIGDWGQKRDRARRAAPRDFGTKERESKGREVVLGTLLKLLVKDELLHSGKVPVNPWGKTTPGTEVQRYGTLNKAMKMWWNNFQFLHRTATHLL